MGGGNKAEYFQITNKKMWMLLMNIWNRREGANDLKRNFHESYLVRPMFTFEHFSK